MHTKQELRARLKAKLGSQTPAERRKRSRLIAKKLWALREFKKARCVCFYVAFSTEVDTVPMIRKAIRAGKRVVAPGVEAKELDVVIVPGLVFDEKNNRLGRGKGFYDRFLSTLDPRVRKVGLAFSFQVVPSIPTESHDVPMDLVLTD